MNKEAIQSIMIVMLGVSIMLNLLWMFQLVINARFNKWLLIIGVFLYLISLISFAFIKKKKDGRN